jgi:hypothetical protein
MLNLLCSAGARRLSIAAALVFAVPAALVFGQCIVPVPVPQPAQAQGFTTLAFDGDMTKGFDVSCANPATANHQWYLGANHSMQASCANLTYPHTDETDGSTVLDVHLGPSTLDGAILGRVGISTSDFNSSHSTNFPINAYYECVVRYDSFSISHVPLWSNCWEADVNTTNTGTNSIEYDFTEFHGGYQPHTELAGALNWTCNAGLTGCGVANWFGDPASIIPGYDPAKFHKYGVLQYQTDPNTIHMKGYIDDVLVHEGDTKLTNTQGSNTPFADNQKERLALVADLTGACQWEANEGDIARCQNLPITNIFADASGNAHVKTSVTSTTMSNEFPLIIVGAGGTTPFNGPGGYFAPGVWGQHGDNWGWWLPGQPCVDANSNVTGCEFSLLDSPGGSPVKFSGTYTGGGTINPWSDPGMHMYVKSFRVWSCANWKTTECSTYNRF